MADIEEKPLGLQTRTVWVEERVQALQAALWRYSQSERYKDSTAVGVWIRELKEHLAYLQGVRDCLPK